MSEGKQSLEPSINCLNCRFFQGNWESGECRRFPPVYVSELNFEVLNRAGLDDDCVAMERQRDEVGSPWVWHYPIVEPCSPTWCGEYKLNPKEPERGYYFE